MLADRFAFAVHKLIGGGVEVQFNRDASTLADMYASLNLPQGTNAPLLADIEDMVAKDTWALCRNTRNALLAETDWMVLPDSPYKNNADVLAYRQELRDIPSTYATPEDVVWPDKPDV